MAVSKEVQEAVDKVRAMKDYIRADKEADKVRDKQLAEAKSALDDAKAKLDALQAKVDALPVNRELSDEDKEALRKAFEEAADAQDKAAEANEQATQVHEELKDAVPANAEPVASGGATSGSGGGSNASIPSGDDPSKFNIPPVGTEGHPTEPLTQGDVLAANGPANHPAGGSQPMMPNMAFDPDPTGGSRAAAAAGQPAQPAAIETAGGFVVQGGGTTQRAPGSSPESPSSSQVVPLDPDAKAPVSTADLVKSGLGDSSQNALIGNDLKPVDQSPGMPQEPSPQAQEAAQKQADLAEQERQRREENPLNLAPAGTPQAGSPEFEKANREAALEAQRKAQEQAQAEKDRNSDQKGVTDDGSGNRAVMSDEPAQKPQDSPRSKEDQPNAPAG